MPVFGCERCGSRVSTTVTPLTDRSRLNEDGWSVRDQQEYVPRGTFVVGRADDIYTDVEGDYLLNSEDVVTMDRFDAVSVESYADFFGCCGLTGQSLNTFCPNGHPFATEISDHCSRVVRLHRDRVSRVSADR